MENNNKRIFLVVLDSFGIGEMEDAQQYGDAGSNTLRSVSGSDAFCLPNLEKLGLFAIDGVTYHKHSWMTEPEPIGAYAKMTEASAGKDTTIGHWEISGILSKKPLPVYPQGFPKEILEEFSKRCNRGVLCNMPYSGTEVIKQYGDLHCQTGDLIVYTSADSVFQIAAHEDIVSRDLLYQYCEIARELLQGEHAVGRVIARPFAGTSGQYLRTAGRHDYSLEPQGTTMLDVLMKQGLSTIGVGKIKDIFAGRGISESVYTANNQEGIQTLLNYMNEDFTGLCFVNLVDYDMLFGHRNDIEGYAAALTAFDQKLPEILGCLRDGDLLMITADHGCDPGYVVSTDHTREYTPFLMTGPTIRPQNLGVRSTFADIAATIQDYFDLPIHTYGKSMLRMNLEEIE